MGRWVPLLLLILVPVFGNERNNECTLADLMSLSNTVKSMAASILENAKITCINVHTKSAYASCPSDYSVTSCSCGMGCGSWDIQSEVTCHCQCGGMDWTTARCCRITTKC